MELESENSVALKVISELRKQFEDLPPPNATRLKIQDESSKLKQLDEKEKSPALDKFKPKPRHTLTEMDKEKEKTKIKKYVDYDLAELVKPNRVVKNKVFKTAESIGKKMQNNFAQNTKQLNEQNNLNNTDIKIKDICMLPLNNSTPNKPANKKLLIQEL